MKKMLSIVLALALMLTMVFPAFAESVDLTGDWYASMYGMVLVLTLNEDGSYAMDMSSIGEEEPEVGTWAFSDGAVVMDAGTDTETICAYDAETNTFSVEDMFTFGREPILPFEPAAVRTDATAEEFAGTWNATMVSIFGMTIDNQEAGMNMIVTVGTDTVSITMDMMGEVEEQPDLPIAFADGAMSCMLGEGEETAGYTLYLLEDGMMQADFQFAGETASFYLVAAE